MTGPHDEASTSGTRSRPDAAIVESWAKRGREVQAAVARIRGEASSRHGEVDAVVDPRGHVLDIRLMPHALELGLVRLSRLLVETIQRAQQDAAGQVDQAWQPLTTDPSVREILDFGRQLSEQSHREKPVAEGQLTWEEQVHLQQDRIRRQLGG